MFRSGSLFRLFRTLALGFLGVAALPAVAQLPPAANTLATSQVTLAGNLGEATGLAVDPTGNLYTTDGVNSTVSLITGANGPANVVLPSLATPGQVAVDVLRNLFVAAGNQNVVLKFTYTAGALNLNTPTSLGTGLGNVVGVAVDLTGNVYIVDATNKQVVKVTPTGQQSVIATGLVAPKQIAVDRLGNVFIADSGANAVVFLAAGSSTQSTIGTGFNAPSGVAVDQVNNLYVADTGNSAVKEVPNLLGVPAPANQTTLAVKVVAPTTIAADTRGTLYVGGSGTIVHFSPSAVYFGLIPVNQTTQITPVLITFANNITPALIKVVATGTTGLDFTDAGGDSVNGVARCAAGTSYAVGQSCSLNVTFKPLYAGPRYGAIVMYDASNKVISRTFIGGAGLGPVLTFDPPHTVSLIPLAYNAPSNGIPLSAPHGLKLDSAGNTFFADTNSNRATIIPATDANGNTAKPTSVAVPFGLNGLAINGAGDLIVTDTGGGRMIVVPLEGNGQYNYANIIISGSGYGRPRDVNVDIAGTMFFCDVTNNRILSLTLQGVQTPLAPGLTKGCLGVVVDLYGNVAVSDNGANLGYYIPISGQSPYAIGSGANLNAPWGIAMDASGSVYLASNGSSAGVRVPNENGFLSNADQELITINRAYGIAIDPTGNLFSVPLVGTALPASGYNFNAYLRGGPLTFPQAQTATVSTACITPAASTTTVYAQEIVTANCVTPTPVGGLLPQAAITVANAGNQAPVYSNPNGVQLFGDVDDFPLGSPTTVPKYPSCNFGNPLQPAAACYISVSFAPQSPGTLRQAYLTIPTQDPTPGIVNLLGFTAGSPNGSTPTLNFTQTVPMGVAGPFQDIQFTFTASDASATGSISVTVDGAQLASAELVSGVASFDLPAGLTAGDHKVSATYSGDGKFAPSTTPSIATIKVAPQTATFKIATSAISANLGQSVTLTATLGGVASEPLPTGSVVFFDGTIMLGTSPVNGNGNASLVTSSLATGAHVITYRYMGDTVYMSGTSPAVTVTISTFAATMTTLTITPVQPTGGYVYGTQLTIVAAVNPSTGAGTPTGSVLFNLGGAVTSVALSGKTSTFTVTPNAGVYTLAASYNGDASYATSTGTAPFTVVPIATVTTIKASSTAFAAGSNVTLTASVVSAIGIPTSGTFTFRNKATVLGTANIVKGVGALITSALPGGVDSVTATYSGDLNDKTSTSAPLIINASFNATTLTNGAATVIVYFATVGVPNTLTATVRTSAPATVVVPPTGTVIFMINGVPAVTNFIPAILATDCPPTLASPAVPSMPVGPVALSGSGVASLNQPPAIVNCATQVTTLPLGYKYGVNTVTAVYSGDNDYSPSTTTTTFNYYLVPVGTYDGDFTISASPATYPITIGSTGSGTVTITPVSKYFGYVQVTCAGLPLYATCILAPDQVLLDGTGTNRTMALTILTQAPILVGSVTREQVASRLAGILGAPILLVLVLGSFRRGRKLMRATGLRGLLFLLLLSAGLGSTTACGGHPPVATPSGTYTVQITGTGSGPLNTTITDITDARYGAPAPIVHTFPVMMTFK